MGSSLLTLAMRGSVLRVASKSMEIVDDQCLKQKKVSQREGCSHQMN
jgi:hypothetical protein